MKKIDRFLLPCDDAVLIMSVPQRSPDQTAISVSIGKELLVKIDARAASLGLSRSQYLANLARHDVLSGGDLLLKDSSSVASVADEMVSAAISESAAAPAPGLVNYRSTRRAARRKATPPAPDSRKKAL